MYSSVKNTKVYNLNLNQLRISNIQTHFIYLNGISGVQNPQLIGSVSQPESIGHLVQIIIDANNN